MNQVDAKYINMALAEVLKKALFYRKMFNTPTKSPRTKAAAKIAATEMAITYNFLVKTIGYLGSSILATEAKLIHPQRIDVISDDEIEAIVTNAYSDLNRETLDHKARINHELRQVQMLGEIEPRIKKSLELLAENGVLNKFLDLSKLGAQDVANIQPAEPRGDPRKGAMVRHLLSQGYTHPDARKKAQEIIDLGYGTVQDYELNKEPDFDSKTTPSQEELDAFAEYERIKAGGHLPKTDYNLDLTDSTEVRTKTMLDLLREESEESNA